jgi:hypothetical protein
LADLQSAEKGSTQASAVLGKVDIPEACLRRQRLGKNALAAAPRVL